MMPEGPLWPKDTCLLAAWLSNPASQPPGLALELSSRLQH